jgi:membrane protease YdiL (CAAX protease family)
MRGQTQRGLTLVLIGFVVTWLALDLSARATHSLYGEWGIPIAALVVSLALGFEVLISRTRPAEALRGLGFGRPGRAAVPAGLALAALLLLFYPCFALATGTEIGLKPGWLAMLPGLFAQGGVAEETLFRGFLFRHFRRGRTFGQAAWAASVPFVAVHLLLFLTLPAPVAAAAVVLSVALSFPLMRLFELGRGTIWIPALIHFIVQGSVKVVAVPAERMMTLAIAWMAVSAIVPYLVFAQRPSPKSEGA